MKNNSQKITTFRINLHLTTSAASAEAAETAPDTAADFMFYGSTPEEFDNALSTILDVATDSVYGGQLNGLREIIDRANADLEQGAADTTAESDKAPAVNAKTASFNFPTTEPEAQTPPRRIEHPLGARGLMLLHCPNCDRNFKHFSKEFIQSARCFCGAEIPLDNTAQFEFDCPTCGKHTYGRTNIETASIAAGSMNCICGTNCHELRWDPEARSFHD